MGEKKILLVEDDAVEAMDIKRFLESLGYTVPYVASDGNEAVNKALKLMPDLVLMDIMLKGNINGIEAANMIKDLHIPLIYLTAHSQESTMNEALLTEPNGYLLKPFDVNELKFSIELAIYKNKIEKQYDTLEGIINAHEAPIFSVDSNYRYTSFNTSHARIMKTVYDADIEIGKSMLEYLTEKDRIVAKENIDSALKGENLLVEEYSSDEESSRLYFEISHNPIKDKKGKIVGVAIFARDITEHKKVEKALRISEKNYRTIFEHTGTATIIIDENLNISQANSEFEKISGYSKEEIECKKSWTNFVTKEEYDKLKEYSMLRADDPNAAPPIYETRGKNKNGKIIDILVTITRIPDTRKYLVTLIDVTDRKKAEIALEDSEERFRMLFEESNAIMILIDPNSGDIIDANYSAARFYGYSQKILRSMNVKHINQISQEELNEIRQKILNKEVKYSIFNHKLSNGEVRIVEVFSSPIPFKGGIILFSIINDITQRQKAEDYLEKSEERFRALIYNSTDLIRILDKDGTIIFDSPSSTRILGYPESYLIGKSPMEFIHPADVEMVKKDLREVYENRNPGTPTLFRIRKSDGTYIPVESISKNMAHVPGIEGIVVTTHPIQQRKEMEEALRESEEKYRTLFKEDPSYTLLLSKDCVILDVNNVILNVAGLPKKALIGKNFSKLGILEPEDRVFYLKKITNLLKGDHIEPFESRFMDKNGKLHWILVNLRAIMQNGNVSYILGIASDITEQKIAENKIKSSLKEKNILIQEIHHRVKNNMQIISSLLNLQKRYVDEEEAVNVLMESQNRVKSMAMIHEKIYLSEDLTHINFVDYIESLVSNLFYTYNIKTSHIKPILKIEDISLNMETAVPGGLIISENHI